MVAAINKFSAAMVEGLGLGRRVELSSAVSLWSASQQLQRLQKYLADAANSFEERIDRTLPNDSSTEASALRQAWKEATLGGASPTEAAFACVQPMAALLRQALDEIAPYTSAGTREDISHVVVRLDEVPTLTENLADGLRGAFHDDSISQGTLKTLHMALSSICTSLSIAVIVVDRLTYEHERGRAFPGRS